MKGKIWIAVGVAAVAGLVYYLRSRKKPVQIAERIEKENERHHLTNVFSKAKQVAVGN